MGIAPDDRRKHMIENMHVLRHLWTKDNEPFDGQFVKFTNITLEPKPVQNPCPIWLATNAERLSKGQADFGGSEFALTRVGQVADGWMTHSVSPEGFRKSWDFILAGGREQGRDMSRFDHVLYHHINVNDDREQALADSKKFLDLYYTANYSKERLEAWLTYGSPRDCIEHLKRYKAHGCRRITFRISTMADPLRSCAAWSRRCCRSSKHDPEMAAVFGNSRRESCTWLVIEGRSRVAGNSAWQTSQSNLQNRIRPARRRPRARSHVRGARPLCDADARRPRRRRHQDRIAGGRHHALHRPAQRAATWRRCSWA